MSEESLTQRGIVTASRLPALLRQPALPILFVAWLAMVKREYAPDISLYSGAIALVVADDLRWGGRVAPAKPVAPDANRGAMLGLTLLCALGLSVMPRQSGPTDLAFVLVGLVALYSAWMPGREAGLAPRYDEGEAPRRWWIWPGLGVAMGLIAGFSFMHQIAPMVDSPAHPSISSLIEPALDPWPVRLLALWLWFLGGWWLLRRIRQWAS